MNVAKQTVIMTYY